MDPGVGLLRVEADADRLTPAHPKLELDVSLCLRALAPFATMQDASPPVGRSVPRLRFTIRH